MSDPAVFIVGAMLLLLAVGVGLGVWLARRLRPKSRWSLIAGVVAGTLVGWLALSATFMEDTWSPPPEVALEVPPGFTHDWVYVLADPKAGVPVIWEGRNLPFMSQHARLRVPASGVLRVQELGALDGGGSRARLVGDRDRSLRAYGTRTLGDGRRVVTLGFGSSAVRESDPTSLDDGQLAEHILRLEASGS